jgi:hypothetical protein
MAILGHPPGPGAADLWPDRGSVQAVGPRRPRAGGASRSRPTAPLSQYSRPAPGGNPIWRLSPSGHFYWGPTATTSRLAGVSRLCEDEPPGIPAKQMIRRIRGVG